MEGQKAATGALGLSVDFDANLPKITVSLLSFIFCEVENLAINHHRLT